MRDDLISRQAAIDALADYIHNVDKVMGTGHLTADDCKDAATSVLEELPSAERKNGKWIIRDNPGTGWYRVTCSECGEDVTSTVPVIGFFPDAKVLWDYCPYCGADMRGDTDE